MCGIPLSILPDLKMNHSICFRLWHKAYKAGCKSFGGKTPTKSLLKILAGLLTMLTFCHSQNRRKYCKQFCSPTIYCIAYEKMKRIIFKTGKK